LRFEQQEKIVNKMLNFLQRIMDSYEAENDNFKDFILSNCYQLIYISVFGSKCFFSKEYLNELEIYLNVTYLFLEKLKSDQLKNNKINANVNYIKILDEMISQF